MLRAAVRAIGQAFAGMALIVNCIAAAAAADSAYPSKPVRVVVGFPPGTPPEIVGRLIADRMSTSTGGNFVIENRPGAGGTIAATAVAQAAPDGYTLMVGVAAALSIAPHFLPSARYDPVKSFTPIGFIQRGPFIYVVRSELPVNTLRDLVGYARSHPGTINFGTPGVGTPHHLALELLKQRYKLDITHVPFQGSPAMVNETIAGRTQAFMENPTSAVMAQVRAGKLRLLAVTSSRRSSLMPEVPTVIEQGFPDAEVGFWWCLVGPAGMPRDIVVKLNAELNKALGQADIRERFRAEGIPDEMQRSSTPEELAETITAEFTRWGPIVKASGLKAE